MPKLAAKEKEVRHLDAVVDVEKSNLAEYQGLQMMKLLSHLVGKPRSDTS